MAFGNLKYQTQLPGFDSFRTQLGEQEAHERGGSEEPPEWTALRAAQADPLGAGAKARKKRPVDPYEALYMMELEGGL